MYLLAGAGLIVCKDASLFKAFSCPWTQSSTFYKLREIERREYRMQGFKSAGHAQRFLSAYGPIAQHFRPRRHLLSASTYREEMRNRFESWAEITGTARAA